MCLEYIFQRKISAEVKDFMKRHPRDNERFRDFIVGLLVGWLDKDYKQILHLHLSLSYD